MATSNKNDLVIKNGKIFNAGEKTFKTADISIINGLIERIDTEIDTRHNEGIFNADGMYITPGLIDFHVHCFRYGQLLGIDTEELAPRSGTTTFIDAGSCGSINFNAFNEYVIKPSSFNIFAFLNVSALGQHQLGIKGIQAGGENDNENFLHTASAVETIEKNRDSIIGVKVRMYEGLYSDIPLKRAREIADETCLPVMVHIGPDSIPLKNLFSYLKSGDIVTHIFHGGDDNIISANGKVYDYVKEARQKGIEFDVGLDRVHGSFQIIKQALSDGFYPDYISTDLAMVNRHATVDMPTTVSKFSALGMTIEEAVYRSSCPAAKKINKPGISSSLVVGAPADIGIFTISDSPTVYNDTYGNSVTGNQNLQHVCTIKRGRILKENNRFTEIPKFLAD